MTQPAQLDTDAFDARFRWVIRQEMYALRNVEPELTRLLDTERGFDALYAQIRDTVQENLGHDSAGTPTVTADRYRVKVLAGRAIAEIIRQAAEESAG
jgi:hypothetical protein